MGGDMPEQYKQYAKTWTECNPGWEYKLWTEENDYEIYIPNRNLYKSITHLGQKSDFLRYHILNQFGGVYADTDFECLKSFNSLSYLDFFIGVGYPTKVELYIGLIGSIPNHPILKRAVETMRTIDGNGWRGVFNTTGTYFFTNNFFKVVRGDDKGIVALPTDYFYPFPNVKNHHELNGSDYVKDCSYAVHHWAVSWKAKKKKV
jgi:mannosyltransferase OCH1-like enzyme